MKALLNALKNRKTLIFIDFEGTQFSHEIIASGLVKCHIDQGGNILDYDKEGLLLYTRPISSIGKIVTNMTSLTEEFIKANGLSWGDTIEAISNYVGEEINDCLFVCFGSNDLKMVTESCRMSHPTNSNVAKAWLADFFDIMTFMSQFIRDNNGNNYSLVNFLKLFSLEPVGNSHNPLNDAYDLLNLYQAFIKNKDIVFEEYLKQIKRMRIFPSPIKETIASLIDGKDVTSEDFKNKVKSYLE